MTKKKKKKSKNKATGKPKRKTMNLSELTRLCVVNSDKIPKRVEINGRRMHWVGIGMVDEGPAEGNEVVIIDDE